MADRYYTQRTDPDGAKRAFYFVMPASLYEAILELVRSGRWPYRSCADVVRDAVAHFVAWRRDGAERTERRSRYRSDWLQVERQVRRSGAVSETWLVVRVRLRGGILGTDGDSDRAMPADERGVEAARYLAVAMRRERHRNQVVGILDEEGLFDPAGHPFLPVRARRKGDAS